MSENDRKQVLSDYLSKTIFFNSLTAMSEDSLACGVPSDNTKFMIVCMRLFIFFFEA